MRILLTNNHLNTFGGTETWTYTMYKALISLGHEVVVFSLQSGLGLSKKMTNIKMNSTAISGDSFDLCIVNHNSCLKIVREAVKGSRIVFTCHGTIPKLEKPMEGADVYVGISQETSNYIESLGFKSSGFINNPIDLEYHTPTKELPEHPTKMLSFCQSKSTTANLVQLGYRLDTSNPGFHQRRLITPDIINESHICVSLGRGVYESLACGRPVLVYDERKYNKLGCLDGVITEDNIDKLLVNNCSGRTYNAKFDLNAVKADIQENYVANTDYYRSIAEERFDSIKIAKQYLEL
jgi:hypothetical protein